MSLGDAHLLINWTLSQLLPIYATLLTSLHARCITSERARRRNEAQTRSSAHDARASFAVNWAISWHPRKAGVTVGPRLPNHGEVKGRRVSRMYPLLNPTQMRGPRLTGGPE